MLNESNLHPYQRAAKSHIIENTHCGLFLDMGLGKTVSTLTAIKYLMFDELEISKVLVIAPKRVVESVWKPEGKKWGHLLDLDIVRVTGTEKQRKNALKEKADIYLLGRDNTAWMCGQYGGNMLPFDMLVIDESSSFKNPKSIRFKALRQVQPCFKRVVILTGTPAPNGLVDLWSQIYLLDRGERLGKFITRFRQEYFTPGQSNGHIVYSYKANKGSQERIYSRISDICMSMRAEDYLDLPGRVNNFIDIPFPDKVQKQYDDFEMEQVLEFLETEETISAVNAAALSNKLLQFANGAVYNEDKEWREVHKLKLEALEDIVESASGKSVLVAWTYRHDMYRIMKHLKKYKPVQMKGDKDVLDWNNGKIQVMLMHPASGGHGLNLQKGGNTVVWFGQTWSLELYQQLNARLDRQGQKEVTIVHHLIASKTIDTKVLKAIERKDSKQEGLMQAIKATISKYS